MSRYLVYIVVAIWAVTFSVFAFNGIAFATCKDGSISYSKQRSGTCSKHGGVYKWR